MASSRLYCALGYACNNNCLICVVDSEKKARANLDTAEIINYLKVLDTNPHIKSIEFSGGEPTIRKDFIYILDWVYQRYPNICYTIFSNGRRFSDIDLANKMSDYPIKNLIIAVHGKDSKTHDLLTQRKGSFNETFMGIRNLTENRVNVTLKIIPTKQNYKQIPDIVRMIVSSFPDVKTLSFNGIDLGGCALANIDKTGIMLTVAMPYIQEGIHIANSYGVKVYTYSIPRCLFKPEFRKYVGVQKNVGYKYKSPFHNLDSKTDEYGYGPLCHECSAKDDCAGCWNTYLSAFGTNELKPINKAKGSSSQSREVQKKRHLIDITGACNNDCLFCLFNGSRDKSISIEEIILRIDHLNLKIGDLLVLSGGEPTLRNDLIQIIEHANSEGYNVSMISNGRGFSDKFFTEQVFEAGVHSVTVDIHAHTQRLHDYITQRKGSFDETVSGVGNLLDVGATVIIKVMVNKLNYKYLEDIVKYICRNMPKVNSIVFASISVRGSALRNKERIVVKLIDAAPYIQKAIEKAKLSGIRIQLDMFPYCIFDKKYFGLIRTRKHESLFLLNDSDITECSSSSHIKRCIPICKDCRFNDKCPRVWKNYIDIYGDDEFKPIN